ncbi:MAG: hypothetical protein ACOCQ4_01645 [bacterium]
MILNDGDDELKDNLKFAEKVDKIWQKYEKGGFKKKDFLEKLKGC